MVVTYLPRHMNKAKTLSYVYCTSPNKGTTSVMIEWRLDLCTLTPVVQKKSRYLSKSFTARGVAWV